MKKFLSLALCGLMCLTAAGCTGKVPSAEQTESIERTAAVGTAAEETEMTKTEREFEGMMKDLGTLPVTFVYNDSYHDGFDRFAEKKRTRTEKDGKISYDIRLSLGKELEAEVIANYYRGHNAWDYTVYFSNRSTEESGVLKYVNDINMDVVGASPVLKGLHGDHSSQYLPYEKDLTEAPAQFSSLLGRATHEEMPYFDLEHAGGHTLVAIGWGGTWQAEFAYDAEKQATHITGNGTVGLETYLKPGETVRTALIAVLQTEEKEEDVAMNRWRRWIVDCVMPRDHAGSDLPVQPISTASFAGDAGRAFSDGSIAEGYDSWKNSYDAMLGHGIRPDFNWVDAGWYCDPYGKTIPYTGDWWGTVGTWELDPVKWPDKTFRERVDYGHEHGVQTFLWFEPERVTHLDGLVQNYGYRWDWALSDHGNNNTFINNLGDPDCLDWTTKKILTMMEENDIDLYREDFNLDPYLFWNIGDGYEGSDRKGITENLYMQGHYELLDRIIAWCAKHGKKTYVDSCASGGGRNDLETLRRAVPFMRSDSDRTDMPLALAMRTRLDRWIPFTGRDSKEAGSQLATGSSDLYSFRATYLCRFGVAADFYQSRNTLDWDLYKKCIAEWESVKEFLLCDYFVLTPQRAVNDDINWTAYMYLDEAGERGFLEAFRPRQSTEKSFTVQLKGLDPDRFYTLRDADGVQTLARVRGSALMRGIRLYAEDPRTALLFYITPAE